jgi:hypothetical protein
MKDQREIESVIKQRLEEIKPVPPRDPQSASRGRAQFLGMAVSASELPRQKGWMSIFRKERYTMNIVLSILVIAGLLFGGGATVSAAQDDLPNESLYALKTWTEDLSLQLQNSQEQKVDRLMELAQIRMQEMTRLTELGEPIPDRVRLRLEQHIRQALQICADMDDPDLERTLLQLRDRLRDHDRDMEQLQIQAQDKLQLQSQDQLQLQTQTRTMLQERLRLVEDGLTDHEEFRHQVQNNFQYGQDDEVTPPVQNQNQNQDQNQNSNQDQNQNQNQNQNEQQNGEPNPDPGSNSNDSGAGNNGNDSGGGNTNDNGSGGGGKP